MLLVKGAADEDVTRAGCLSSQCAKDYVTRIKRHLIAQQTALDSSSVRHSLHHYSARALYIACSYTAYLLAALVMIAHCNPFKVRYFIFVARCAVRLHLQSFLSIQYSLLIDIRLSHKTNIRIAEFCQHVQFPSIKGGGRRPTTVPHLRTASGKFAVVSYEFKSRLAGKGSLSSRT